MIELLNCVEIISIQILSNSFKNEITDRVIPYISCIYISMCVNK